ncbi:MAG: hypothetical protein AAB348_00230 [Patescibacteria group bacterium]
MQVILNKIYRFFVPQGNPHEIKKKYGIPDQLNWSIEITNDDWFIAECKDLPGLFTQARSKQELLDMVNDAVLTYFSVPKKESDFVFNEFRLPNNETIRYEAKLQTA